MPDMTIRKAAALAKLKLTPDEENRLEQDMAELLRMADHLKTADVEDVPPTLHVIPLQSALRDDIPGTPAAAEIRPVPRAVE